jgi:hypothetical protein
MSIGHLGESEETIKDTHKWLTEVDVDDFDVSIITTYPGSPYYDHALLGENPGQWTYTYPKSGDRLHATEIDYNIVSDYYKGDPNGGYKAYVHTDDLTSETLVALRDWVEGDVRKSFGIPYNVARPSIRYEHSMGQLGGLPPTMLRSTHKESNGREVRS